MKRALAFLVFHLAAPAGAMTLAECEAGVANLYAAMPRTEALVYPAQSVDADGWCVFVEGGSELAPGALRWRSAGPGAVQLAFGPVPMPDAPTLRGSALLRHTPGAAALSIDAWFGWGPGNRLRLETALTGIDLSSVPMAQMSVGAARLEAARVIVESDAGFLPELVEDLVGPGPDNLEAAAQEVLSWPGSVLSDGARAAFVNMLDEQPADGLLEVELRADPPVPVATMTRWLLYAEMPRIGPDPRLVVESLSIGADWTAK